MRKAALLITTVLLTLGAAKPAQAITLGDAALTVAITTGAGAALGASTLPFYGDSGAHSKNIFYGAALGAVAGVFISAASGVTDPDAASDVTALRSSAPAENSLAQKLRLTPDAILTTNAKKRGETLFWSPLAKLSF
ncbi:MAG: hypothetical protein EOP11_07450 [Proteobacteria bacterium]|nr:MAG: hypothetical protein EOP11_07450 [Pseudomonadota bacterium]